MMWILRYVGCVSVLCMSTLFIGCSDKVEGNTIVVPDVNSDSVLDGEDNCPLTSNTEQLNGDGDSFGDACDNCPLETNEDQLNSDDGAVFASAEPIPFRLRGPLDDLTVAVQGDDGIELIDIGFPVLFFGETYTQLWVSTNGFVTFNDEVDDGCCSGQEFPDVSPPNGVVEAPYHRLSNSRSLMSYPS